ncbi:MAG: ribonuclease III, partial [Rhodothermales bacterium]|nr:ribonuclease III [Rhodothermales bacterium]
MSPIRNLWNGFVRLLSTPAVDSNSDYVQRLAQLVGRPPRELKWYRQALRHRSVLQADKDVMTSNERLEFLGDAILGLIVAEDLFSRYPASDEGFLTKLRARLVNGKSLARCARSIRLGDYIELSENMDRAAGRDNRSILSDTYEAVIGAIYLDHGLDAAREFVSRTLLQTVDVEELAHTRDNYKSLLLELTQARSWPQPGYEVVSAEGPDHEKSFRIKVS